MQCACGKFYRCNYTNDLDDQYCPKCRELINRSYSYTNRDDFIQTEITNKITEVGGS